jgi:hypothetical protein
MQKRASPQAALTAKIGSAGSAVRARIDIGRKDAVVAVRAPSGL